MPASSMGSTPGSLGTVASNVTDDLGLATVASPSYPSTELIRQLAAQTGAQLPFNTSQHSLLQAPSSRVEDLSLYDTSAAHSTHSSGSAPPSQSGTPGPYESTLHSRTQLSNQAHNHAPPHVQQAHPQHSQLQAHQIGINSAAYDPRFTVQGFDPSMVFKQDDGESTGGHIPGPGSLYNQVPNREGMDQGRAHGARYGG